MSVARQETFVIVVLGSLEKMGFVSPPTVSLTGIVGFARYVKTIDASRRFALVTEFL
jgi:hypothetical protein